MLPFRYIPTLQILWIHQHPLIFNHWLQQLSEIRRKQILVTPYNLIICSLLLLTLPILLILWLYIPNWCLGYLFLSPNHHIFAKHNQRPHLRTPTYWLPLTYRRGIWSMEILLSTSIIYKATHKINTLKARRNLAGKYLMCNWVCTQLWKQWWQQHRWICRIYNIHNKHFYPLPIFHNVAIFTSFTFKSHANLFLIYLSNWFEKNTIHTNQEHLFLPLILTTPFKPLYSPLHFWFNQPKHLSP